MAYEQTLPKFNPYDPSENELLLIEPSFNSPTMTLDKARNFLRNMDRVLDETMDFVRIRGAMTFAEYITSYNHLCLHPVELDVRNVTRVDRVHDFTVKVMQAPTHDDAVSNQVVEEPQVKVHP